MSQDDAVLGSQHGGTMGGQQGNNYRYGYTTSQSYHGGMNNQGGDTLPHNHALHVNTGENRYATIGGQQAAGQGQGQG